MRCHRTMFIGLMLLNAGFFTLHAVPLTRAADQQATTAAWAPSQGVQAIDNDKLKNAESDTCGCWAPELNNVGVAGV